MAEIVQPICGRFDRHIHRDEWMQPSGRPPPWDKELVVEVVEVIPGVNTFGPYCEKRRAKKHREKANGDRPGAEHALWAAEANKELGAQPPWLT